MYSRSLTCFLVSIVLIWLVGSGGADIFNGGFELSDPVNSFGVKPPTGWKSNNYTNTVSRLEMDLINWRVFNWNSNIVANGLDPYEGGYLVLLSTGNVEPDRIRYAKLSQEITIQKGERISGVFFFGACDYLPFDDYAEIRLMPDPNTMPDPNNIITLVSISITTLGMGDYASTDGWEYFEYVFSQQEAGKYTLVIGVYDDIDLIYNSYLAVDALSLCQAPDNGDVNNDCDVDLQDFSLLASDWLKDCADPNESCHPNTELSGDDIIDFGDLDLFLNYWMF